MLNVSMLALAHLFHVRFSAHSEVSAMVDVSKLLQLGSIFRTLHIDVLHLRPKSALGRHVDLIRVIVVDLLQEEAAMGTE